MKRIGFSQLEQWCDHNPFMQIQRTESLKKKVDQNHRTAGNNSVTHVTLKLRRRKSFP